MLMVVFILFIFGAIAFFILDIFFGYYEEWLKCEALINLAKGNKNKEKKKSKPLFHQKKDKNLKRLNYNEELLEKMKPYVWALNHQYKLCSKKNKFNIEKWENCLKHFAKNAVEDELEHFDFDEYNDTFKECFYRASVKFWVLDHFDEITKIYKQFFDNKNVEQNEKENQQFLAELNKFCKNNMDSSLFDTLEEHPNLVFDLYCYIQNFFRNNDNIEEKFKADFDYLNELFSKYLKDFNEATWENGLSNFAVRNNLVNQYDYEIFNRIFSKISEEKEKINHIKSINADFCEDLVNNNMNSILILKYNTSINKNSNDLENNYNKVIEKLRNTLISDLTDERFRNLYLEKFQVKIEEFEDVFNKKYKKLMMENSCNDDDKKIIEEKVSKFFDKVREAKEGNLFNSDKWETISNEICSKYLTQNYNSTFLLNEILEAKKRKLKLASPDGIKTILKENINKIYVPYKIDNTHLKRIINIIKSKDVRKSLLNISKENFDKFFYEVVDELTNEFTEKQLKHLKDEIQTSIEPLSQNFEKCFYLDEYQVKKFDIDKWTGHVQYFQDNMLEDEYNQFIITKVFLDVYLE